MVGLTTKAIRTFKPFADIGAPAMKVEERDVLHSIEHNRYLTEVNDAVKVQFEDLFGQPRFDAEFRAI